MFRTTKQLAADEELLEEAFGLSQMRTGTDGIVPGGEILPESPRTGGPTVFKVLKNHCMWPLAEKGMVCGAPCEDKKSEYCEECKRILQARIAAYREAMELHLFVFRRVHVTTRETKSDLKARRFEAGVGKDLDGVRIGRTGARWRPE